MRVDVVLTLFLFALLIPANHSLNERAVEGPDDVTSSEANDTSPHDEGDAPKYEINH